MGPFGTYLTLDTFERTIVWACIVGWGLFMIAVSMSFADRYLTNLSFKQEEIGRLLIMPPVIIIPLYPAVQAYLAPDPMPISVIQGIIACYLLGGIVTCARFATMMNGAVEADAAEAGPRLLKRLPSDAEGPILRISGKGHFVEIVTETSRHEVRMRLADAVDEMDNVDGFFTHRSHWVARAAIHDVERKGGKHFVISADEERIPISKGTLTELEEAGFVKT